MVESPAQFGRLKTLIHLGPVSGVHVNIADHHREVPMAAELGNDLLIQPALVVFDRQEQVGALLGGEMKNAGEVCSASAWISTPSRSSSPSSCLSTARSWFSPVA
jgi:hypothetical protein